MSAPGWYPDPSRRFAVRWYDGQLWTPHVQGPDGRPAHDDLAPQQQPQQQLPHQPLRYRPGVGLALGLVGLVLVALSLFVLKWVDADKGGFLDLSSALRDASSDPLDQPLAYAFGTWAGFALAGVSAVLVLLAGIPIPATRGPQQVWRIAGAVVAGAGAVLQTTLVALFPEVEAGAWLGVAGFLVVCVGMIAGPHRVRDVR